MMLSARCDLQADPSQELFDHAADFPLPQHTSFPLNGFATLAQFEARHRYWTVLPIPLDFVVPSETITKN